MSDDLDKLYDQAEDLTSQLRKKGFSSTQIMAILCSALTNLCIEMDQEHLFTEPLKDVVAEAVIANRRIV